jgi:hypothetical protein
MFVFITNSGSYIQLPTCLHEEKERIVAIILEYTYICIVILYRVWKEK